MCVCVCVCVFENKFGNCYWVYIGQTFRTCNFDTKNTKHKANTVGMIPCCLLLMVDNWNCKIEKVVTYVNSVIKVIKRTS